MSDEQNVAAPETAPEAAKAEEPVVVKAVEPQTLKAGMTVRVHEKIKDVNAKGEERERTQVFEGMILSLRGTANSRTMTVRKEAGGWAVEKIFPLKSPIIEKVEVVKIAKVRRAKLSYLSSHRKGVKERKKPFKRAHKEKRAE